MNITITPSRRKLLYNWFLPTRLWRRRLKLSAIPTNTEQDDSLAPIEDPDLAKIINSRFDINPTSRISAVFGNPDFLPFSFLELGLRRGTAVCRLVRNFSEPASQEIVEIITEFEEELKNSQNDSLSRKEVEEIFSISEKEQGFDTDFFAETDEARPSDALREPERFRKLLPIPVGTGFLVGSSYLLTNHHVLPNQEVCYECIAEFGYDQDVLGRKIPPVAYQLDPDPHTGFFEISEELDYTLVKLQDRPQDENLSILGRSGDRFGWIPLDENPTNIAPPVDEKKVAELQAKGFQLRISQGQSIQGEPVNIIQHPKGKRKQVILSSNRVTEIYKNFIHYQADADFSSSGSPVFNQQWQLVALHHAAVAAMQKNGNTTLEIVAEQGVRTCEIVKDLKKKARQYEEEANLGNEQKSDPRAEKIWTFINNFVDTVEKEAENKPTGPYQSAY